VGLGTHCMRTEYDTILSSAAEVSTENSHHRHKHK
jgi:hypothetical protein